VEGLAGQVAAMETGAMASRARERRMVLVIEEREEGGQLEGVWICN